MENRLKEKRYKMTTFSNRNSSLVEELGLTMERATELEKITQTIMDNSTTDNGYGRTSHVLLSIVSRKDLSDAEKAVCTFIFSSRINDNPHDDMCECKKYEDKPKFAGIDITDIRLGISGMVVASDKIEPIELIAVMMASVTSLLRKMPKTDAQNFCRHASLSFARMAMTGDIKL
jgi:hypothetical protein